MLSLQTIEPHTLELLRKLMAMPEMRDLRLVGGTALALQYGHRKSVDLDLFGTTKLNFDEIIRTVEPFGIVQVLNRTPHILQLSVDDVKVDFVEYSCYDWIDNAVVEDGVVLASPKDIAAMKVNAFIGRGTRKDFVDVFELLKHYSFAEIMNFYRTKYPDYSEYRALLSMTYFEDAEAQVMPVLFIDDDWDKMKKAIIEAVREYQR